MPDNIDNTNQTNPTNSSFMSDVWDASKEIGANIGTGALNALGDTAKNYMTPQRLKTLMTKEGWQQLGELEIDACKNFLTGQTTSALKGALSNTYINAAMKTGTEALGVGMSLYGTTTSILTDIKREGGLSGIVTKVTQELVTAATKEIIDYGTKLLMSNVQKMTKLPDMKAITTKAISYFSYWTHDANEQLMYLLEDKSETIERQQETEKTKRFEKITRKAIYVISQVTEWTNTYLSYVKDVATQVSTYYQMGPSWLSQQMNTFLKSYEGVISYFVDEKMKILEEEKQKFIDKETEDAAKWLAQKYNAEVAKVVKSIKENQESKTLKAILKGIRAVNNAKTKIAQKFGIKLPLDKTIPKLQSFLISKIPS